MDRGYSEGSRLEELHRASGNGARVESGMPEMSILSNISDVRKPVERSDGRCGRVA
jgi:hypothetical protein